MSTADKLKTVADNVQKVYNAGAKSAYAEFWDAFQTKGKRVLYGYAFTRWDNGIFKPKYNITPTNAVYMFFQSGSNTKNGIEMDKLEQEYGIKFDFSRAPSLGFAFADNGFWKTLNVVNMTGTNYGNEYVVYDRYNGGTKTRINKLIVKESTKFGEMIFGYCSALTHMIVEGTIGQNGFDVHWSTGLSKESIISIINALSATAANKTVTLSKTAVNTAFETSRGSKDGAKSEEWINLIAQKSNWTITLS